MGAAMTASEYLDEAIAVNQSMHELLVTEGFKDGRPEYEERWDILSAQFEEAMENHARLSGFPKAA